MNHAGSSKTLGIITIATGKYYEEFIPNLKASVDQFFNFDSYTINFYCFTDSVVQIDGVHNIAIKHLGWPFSTLLRYHWIQKNIAKLEQHDFLLYMDADMRVVATPPASILKHPLIAVRHPGYTNSPGPFEIDRQDSCYMAPPLRKNYYQGCFWGGQSTQFIALINDLAQMVNEDLAVGNIPIWHDESYLNKFMATQECEALPPTFAWPEGQIATNQPYVLHLEKRHHIIRQTSENRLNVNDLILGGDCESEMEIYKKLYLKAHEKCQRLENRLVQNNSLWSKCREWLAYYKNRTNAE